VKNLFNHSIRIYLWIIHVFRDNSNSSPIESKRGTRETDIESDVKAIKEQVTEIKDMLHELIHEHEIIGMMRLSDSSLKEFLENEPDIYTLDDAKVVFQ